MNNMKIILIAGKNYKTSLHILLGVLVTLLLTMITGCSNKDTLDDSSRAVVVNAMIVGKGEAEQVFRFTGDVRAQRDIRLLSQVGERIIEFRADRGDFVRENQILAIIENTLLARSVDQAEAGLAAARTTFSNLESEYRRSLRLFEERAISSQQYESIKTQFENANSAVRQAEAALDQVKRQYNNSYIRAPFTGIISNRYMELGDMVMPGTPIFSFIQIDTMHVMAQVSEREFGMINIGHDARLRVGSYPDRVFHGNVAKKTPILDPLTRLATIEVHFPNRERLLIAGMFGELEIITDRKEDVTLIPVSSIQYRTTVGVRGARIDEQINRVPYVYIVKNGQAVRRELTKGYQSAGTVEIVRGVEPGDTLVTRGQHALDEGDPVEIVDLYEPIAEGGGS
jgi:RND family efflux transporter MFP subunit